MFKKITIALLFCLFVLPYVYAVDTEPSDTSVRELLVVTQKKKELEGRLAMIDSLMKASLKHSVGDKTFTKEQQAILDDEEAKMVALFKEGMSWESMEPSLIEFYKKTYTQQEVDDMLIFYKSPAGQAAIAKKPLILENSRQLIQSRMSAMQPKLEQLQNETIERIKKAHP